MDLKQRLINTGFAEDTVEIDGIELVVKEMSSGDAVKYESSLYKMVDGKPQLVMGNSKSKLISMCLFDKDGSRVFEDNDLELINKMPAGTVNKIFEASAKINGIGSVKK